MVSILSPMVGVLGSMICSFIALKYNANNDIEDVRLIAWICGMMGGMWLMAFFVLAAWAGTGSE